MGINLNTKGDLTVSQRIQADALGMPRHKFREQLLERLAEINSKNLPETKRTKEMKRDVISAKNPVLIVGAGESYKENIKEIKNFPGKVISVDFVFNYLVGKQIIPDYVITLESQQNSVSEKMFGHDNIKKCRGKTKVITSSITPDKVIEHFKKEGIDVKRYPSDGEPRCSNVGLLAINYAKKVLEADKIFLVGFEHVGQKYPPTVYNMWQIDFWYFIKDWPKETIVNCTDAGALYYEDYIIDTTLDKVLFI